ncbi:MAG: hypothetical protein P1V35_07985, partial [Planctomycetota bacterium]|nr:hypothetical protein [Planctomycetota bacterium]
MQANTHNTPTVRPARLMGLALPLAAFACLFPSARAATFQEDSKVTREQAALAEEQALIARQIKRLTAVMVQLEKRYRDEGRVHAAGLLHNALTDLNKREGDSGLTIEEQVKGSGNGLLAGRTTRAYEDQTQALRRMERLMEVLLDRKRVEDLEEELKTLEAMRQDLTQLQKQESDLRKETEKLAKDSQSDAQKELAKELEKLTDEQTELLREVEEQGRKSGTFDLERIADELKQSVQDQSLATSALERWRPELSSEWKAAREDLAQARNQEARAAALQKAAA